LLVSLTCSLAIGELALKFWEMMMWWSSVIVRARSARRAPTQRLSLMNPKHVNLGKYFATEAWYLQRPGRSSPGQSAKSFSITRASFALCLGELSQDTDRMLRPGHWRFRASVAKHFPGFTCFGSINERRCVGAVLALPDLTIPLYHHIIIFSKIKNQRQLTDCQTQS
jgi:hypothetical protein